MEESYEPSVELVRQDREIDRMLEQKNLTFLAVKGAILASASSHFDCCKMDYSKAVTDKLIAHIQTLKPLKTLDFSLIDGLVKAIYIDGDGSLSLKFLNEKTVNEKEIIKNASSNDSSEGCNKDSCQPVIGGKE